MNILFSLNGEINDDVRISALDHGFLFGDSVYEVICTWKGRPAFLKNHLIRLRKSAASIYLAIPWTDEKFINEIQKVLDASDNKESYIRIVITRGEGDIDIDPCSCTQPNILIYVQPEKSYHQDDYLKGIALALVSIKRSGRDSLNPAIKTGNYLNNVLAKIESIDLGAKDAVMLNNDGIITESTTSNIFWVRQGFLRTPSLDCGILSGITRGIIIQIAKENGILIEEGQWEKEELFSAEEIFLTGTVKKIMPVSQFNGKAIGDGKPGLLTRSLIKLYDTVLDKI